MNDIDIKEILDKQKKEYEPICTSCGKTSVKCDIMDDVVTLLCRNCGRIVVRLKEKE